MIRPEQWRATVLDATTLPEDAPSSVHEAVADGNLPYTDVTAQAWRAFLRQTDCAVVLCDGSRAYTVWTDGGDAIVSRRKDAVQRHPLRDQYVSSLLSYYGVVPVSHAEWMTTRTPREVSS